MYRYGVGRRDWTRSRLRFVIVTAKPDLVGRAVPSLPHPPLLQRTALII